MDEVLQAHEKVCAEIHELYVRKNADYGNAFGQARREIPCYTIGKLYDKFSRLKNLMVNGESDRAVDDERVEDTLLDMANYCIMEIAERRTDAEWARIAREGTK